ncbi:hypothetical protein ACPW96_21125 [Micromonospora sp. DT81.3]|uniref:hypothetical protein n=1 Tax=Micromonospora sp. DT81.3 TaxID=3416523 RepID=UPI003CED1325
MAAPMKKRRSSGDQAARVGRETPKLAWIPIVVIGMLTIGMGLAFALLRPGVVLLPEDQRYTGLTPEQLEVLDPELFSWIGMVFRSWGAFGIGLGLMITGLGAYGYRRGELWAERLLFVAGLCTFSIFLTVNVLLRSDFALVIGGLFVTFLAALVCGYWARRRWAA